MARVFVGEAGPKAPFDVANGQVRVRTSSARGNQACEWSSFRLPCIVPDARRAESLNDVQQQIFVEIAPQLLSRVFDGASCCVLAAGPARSGKTYTILGEEQRAAGLFPRFCSAILSEIHGETPPSILSLRCAQVRRHRQASAEAGGSQAGRCGGRLLPAPWNEASQGCPTCSGRRANS